MIGVTAELTIKEDKLEETINLLTDMVKKVAEEEGTLAYTVNRVKDKPTHIVIMERYKDMAALKAHSATDHFKAFNKAIADNLAEKPSVRIMEEILSA